MTYSLVPFQPEHGLALQVQRAQSVEARIVSNWSVLEWVNATRTGKTLSGIKDGRVIAVAGVRPVWPGRGELWAMLGEGITHADMLWVHRRVVEFLDIIQSDGAYRRLEFTVRHSFAAGMKWAAMLGFSREGVAACYDPAGNDHVLFARIR